MELSLITRLRRNWNNVLFTFLFTLILPSYAILAQNMVPPVRNYELSEYNGASKNWDISRNDLGEVYVANHLGLLHFDGERWSLNQLPNKTVIRSVEVIGNKIYTGSYEEFGYWMENDFGYLEYTSLSHLIPKEGLKSEEFWQIEALGDAVIFRSFSSLYVYQKDTITPHDNGKLISHMVTIDDSVLLSTRSNGFFWFKDGHFTAHSDNNILMDYATINFDMIGEDILLGTALDGCYVLSNGEISPFNDKLNQELRTSQLNKIRVLHDGNVVFGTIKNGVYLYDIKRAVFSRLNRGGGLQNNTVLSIEEFKNQLWLGLDNGLDRVQLNAPISYYTDYTGVLGNTYDILKVEDGVLLGSNTGVYYLNDEELQFIDGSQGHVWDLAEISGDILGGHNKGTFSIDALKFEMISSTTGGYQLIPSEEDNIYIQGNYNGVGRLKKENGQWNYLPITGFTLPSKYLCFESPHILWVSHPSRGFNRLRLSQDYTQVLEIEEFNDFKNKDFNVKLYRIQNQIVIHVAGVWYRFNEILNTLEEMPEFQKYRNMELLDYSGENVFWWIDSHGVESKSITYTDLQKLEYSFNEKELTDRLVPEAQKVVKINDSIYAFTLTDGFAWVNTQEIENYNLIGIQKPQLQSLSDTDTDYSLREEIIIPYGTSSSVTFNISSPEMFEPNYGYKLNGRKGRLDSSRNGVLQFQNLTYGSHELQVWSIGSDGEVSENLSLEFSISPPWYLSIYSLTGYFLLTGAIALWIRHSSQRRFRRKQLLLKKEMHRQQQELLIQKEKENLAKEIKDKQKKLTKSTLSIAKKNEMILELKRLLLLNKDSFKNPQRYKTIMGKINKTVDNKEEWKHFEVNFTELHEDFFERLLAEFPQLTPKDLKLSAYLKMNLSSKEIAPLMGITTRGVEIHRYRLRKKLKIDSSKNLSNFLIRFK